MAADTFTATLGAILMGTGNDNNTWGANANTSIVQILEDAIANALTEVVTGGTLDLSGSPPPAGPSQVRHAALVFSGALGSAQIIVVPNLTKLWWVQNATSGAFTLKLKTPSGAASTAIPQNSGWQLVQCDGANNIVVSPFNTKQAQMPDGAVALPAYSNINEPNSGWYRAGTQDWRLSINGVDTIQATGAGAATPSTLNFLGSPVVPPGSIMAYDGINLPTGWIFLSGQALSRPIANGGSVDTFKGVWNAITTTVVGSTNANTSITGLGTDMRVKGLNKCFIEGTGIPSGTTITFTGANTGTLSAPAVGSNAGITLRLMPYGQGDASTTFNVRDARNLSMAGRGDMNGTDRGGITVAGGNFDGTLLGTNRAAADIPGGLQNHTLTIPELPVHNHTTTEAPHSHTFVQTNSQNVLAGSGGFANNGTFGGTTGSASTGLTINNAGSGNAHPIMGPTGVTNLIMKL